jgi:hypothetical protein
MQKSRNLVVLALGMILGAIASAAWPGHASAQSPTPGPRYQYKCLTGLPSAIYKPDAQSALNREGEQGWRLLDGMSLHNHMSGADQYCFVRQY